MGNGGRTEWWHKAPALCIRAQLGRPSCARMHKPEAYATGLLLTACLATVMAQTAPTFKANANLVIVNVSATDKAGLPVEGLKAEDFTVLEDGKPQKVSV